MARRKYVEHIRVLSLAFAFAWLTMACGCEKAQPKPALKPMNIALFNWVGYGPFYLGKDKGFFEKEGIDLTIVTEDMDSQRREAFKSGMLDSASGTIDLLVVKRAQDTPVVSVCELDHSAGSDGIVAAEGIETFEQLVGKRVALARGDSGEAFLSYLFHIKGLPLDKVKMVPGDPENISQIFLDGASDAVATWEPELSRALARPGAHIIASTKEYPHIIIDTLDVREDIVKNDPEKVKALMRGWFSSVNYYKLNPIEASVIIAPRFHMTPEEYRKSVQGLRWFGYNEQKKLEDDRHNIGVFDTISSIYFERGRIPKKPSAEEAINTELFDTLYPPSDQRQSLP
jgi:NitT/TauT family transport system substrate-binding protein